MKIAFLWHMHQPYYKDLLTNSYIMPWTFLHLIKDYYDMIKVIQEFDNIKVTFNFVPSLLEQIEDYEESLDNDFFLELLKRPVDSLNENDKKNLLRQLFLANYDNMIFIFKRYKELFEKKENYKNNLEKVFSNEELLDLEVLYLIAWCGYYIKNESDYIKSLINKGKNFSEEEKLNLLKELQVFIKKVIPEYKKLIENKRIEISTSPYFHPILPLLIDINIAKVALPDINIPFRNNSFATDAKTQIELAKKKIYETFNIKVSGMWPSEGSVSEDTANLIKTLGFKWIATDEDILFLSKKGIDKKFLYKLFDYNGLKIFFRDKDLSNLIGFIYSKWNFEDAANDFYNRLKHIQNLTNDENAIVSIILDGENAWEFYRNNGVPFLRKIYSLIESDPNLETVTFSEFIEKNSNYEKLDYLFPGSWINANFKIWIGHPEDNKAWELLDTAKGFLNEKIKNVKDEEKLKLAQKELLIAEGSDWFWWYGDDFYSEMSDKFDSLFRTHLSNIYSIFNEDIPIEFLNPIKIQKGSVLITKPVDIIQPIIDGKVSNYFEWTSAGELNFSKDTSTMHYSRGYFTRILYGFDENNLYIRFDFGADLKEIKDLKFEITIHNQNTFKFKYFFENKKFEFFVKEDNNYKKILVKNLKFCYDKVAELKLPLNELDIKSGENINFYASIYKNGTLIERAPFDSTIKIKIPENIYLDYWKV